MNENKTSEWVAQYAQEIKDSLKSGELKDGEYCVIISTFTGSGFNQSGKNIKKVYKNVEEFEKKGVQDMDDIDPMFGVNVVTYVFD